MSETSATAVGSVAERPVVSVPPRRSIARNVVSLLLGQIGTMAISIVISAIIGRVLGAASLGLLYLVMASINFAGIFVEWGQQGYLVAEVSKFRERSGELLGTALVARLLLAVVSYALALGCAVVLGHGPEVRSLLLLMAVCMIPGNLATTLSQGFRGHDRMELEAMTNIANSVCNLAFLLLAMKLHGGLRSVVLAGGGSVAVSLVLSLFLYRRVKMPPLRLNRQRLRGILAGGAPFVFFNLALSGHPYVDANLLAMLASPSVVGWYAAAQRFVGTLIFPAGIAGVALYPTLARFSGDVAALRGKSRDALRLVLMLGALVATGTALYADVAVSLVYRKEGFAPAIDVLRALGPYLFLMFVNILLGNAILAIGKARTAFTVAKFVALLIGGLLDVILIPWFESRYGNGAIGLAIALTTAELVMTIAALRLAPDGIVERSHWRLAGAALLSAGAMFLAGTALQDTPLVVRFVLPLAVFAVAIRATGLFTVSDGRRIWEAARVRPQSAAA
ncbi:MAG: flippase [Myxococcales bacterium]